ncbi:hypothetical protein HJFPF1_02043 [Paramyrothecium foliicola]|nr:hypothetical protein HJFPF1_02043 [Paramyrothecium foliicola]
MAPFWSAHDMAACRSLVSRQKTSMEETVARNNKHRDTGPPFLPKVSPFRTEELLRYESLQWQSITESDNGAVISFSE